MHEHQVQDSRPVRRYLDRREARLRVTLGPGDNRVIVAEIVVERERGQRETGLVDVVAKHLLLVAVAHREQHVLARCEWLACAGIETYRERAGFGPECKCRHVPLTD